MRHTFILLVMLLVVSGCTPTTEEQQPQPIDTSYFELQLQDTKNMFQTNATLGITMLADTIPKEHISYEHEHGIITAITKEIEPVTTDVLNELQLTSPYALDDLHTLTWDASDVVTTLRITRNAPTLKQTVYDMPLDEKIGQLIITGFEGTTITEELRRAVEEQHISNIILFSKNIVDHTQLQQFATNFHALEHTYPLWISIDEEGGNVSRLPDELVSIPTATTLANNHSTAEIERIANHLGQALLAYGIQVNFAPVMDVNSNPKNPVIGTRSFSDDASIVSQYALAFHHGLTEAHVLTAMKHFPGHGDTDIDSHHALPVLPHSKEQLYDVELVPFIEAIQEQAPMIMVGHLLIPALDDTLPASVSPAVITELLRQELGYTGLVVTDDITMDALDMPIADIAVQTLVAGSDLVLIGHGLANALTAQQAIIEAVEQGVLTEERINTSVLRVLRQKQMLGEASVKQFSIAIWNDTMRQLLQSSQ